jgi:glutamine---fructose-6-phosphate transaminase (isomerizing)
VVTIVDGYCATKDYDSISYMCGIFGVFVSQKFDSFEYSEVKQQIEGLFQASLRRGSEAAGLAIQTNKALQDTENTSNTIEICKAAEHATRFLSSNEYQSTINSISSTPLKAIIGHARLATNGSSRKQTNNQPVVSQFETVIGVHNGIITNFKSLPQKNLYAKKQIPDLDTQIALDFIEQHILKKKQTIVQTIQELLSVVEGTLNLALLFPKDGKIALVTNHGSLYIAKSNTGKHYFSSESVFLKKILSKQQKQANFTITKLELSVPYLFDINENTKPTTFKKESSIHFTFKENSSKPIFINTLAKLKKHTIDTKKTAAIPRCKKCILPVTTPFITFDADRVCNYCHEHAPISYKGPVALEEILGTFRNSNRGKKSKKHNNKPDCLVAFSGGRDSSYGLHLIKNELGMNPIAYTYDWGMISDLGRRNQARVLEKLEVEHIVVSADIAMKRRHIKKNILAWLKKPHLGMVPLFMQGDKQCEFYADRIMKEYDIPLMFYCRGNELEKEEFKTGHCGVRDADPGGVIHDLAWKNKLKLLSFYGLQYLQNPSYFNESTFDTAFAYFSTYVQPHTYVYLWHYLPWNEQVIVDTLTHEYNWELSPETPTSWRIGDGTPAFYNYIYYQVQGFTENDSLRARQIREGILSRKQALELVAAENAPQYQNLKWYFDTLELDGDAVLTVVDKMKRLY